jgi:hypothetical protein
MSRIRTITTSVTPVTFLVFRDPRTVGGIDFARWLAKVVHFLHALALFAIGAVTPFKTKRYLEAETSFNLPLSLVTWLWHRILSRSNSRVKERYFSSCRRYSFAVYSFSSTNVAPLKIRFASYKSENAAC